MSANDEWTDIGHGVSVQVRYIGDDLHGVAYRHPNEMSMSGFDEGWVPLKPRSAGGWDLISLDPLTVSPSLLCRICGHHGFIRDGEWVPA